jgi:NAD(P)-dependent dehydrogenase (short-subunit alcohol dehydrogenase family)
MSEPRLNPLASFGLEGQRIIITGASGALGRVIALALSELGARQLLVSGSAGTLAEVAEEARARGGEVHSLARRPDDEAGVDEIFQTAVSTLGGVDSVFVAS